MKGSINSSLNYTILKKYWIHVYKNVFHSRIYGYIQVSYFTFIYHKQPFPQHPHQGTFPLKCTFENEDIFLTLSAVSQLLILFVLSLSEWSSAKKLEPYPNPNPVGIERSVQTEKDLSRKLLGSITTLGRPNRYRSPRLCFLCFFGVPGT